MRVISMSCEWETARIQFNANELNLISLALKSLPDTSGSVLAQEISILSSMVSTGMIETKNKDEDIHDVNVSDVDEDESAGESTESIALDSLANTKADDALVNASNMLNNAVSAKSNSNEKKRVRLTPHEERPSGGDPEPFFKKI